MLSLPSMAFPSMREPEKICWVVEACRLPYTVGLALQHAAVAARKSGAIPDVLIFCEHPHVITAGRNARPEHLLASEVALALMGVEFHSTDRGGDVTYHGPGQIVGYPILNLAEIRRDVAWYIRGLEEAMIRATAEYGIAAHRVSGGTGVWVDAGASEEKLAAIGVHLSRWVTSHGFAYNGSTDLRYFDLIVPCGIRQCRATSLERILGSPVTLAETAARIAGHLGAVLGLTMQPVPLAELEKIEQLQPVVDHLAPMPVAV